MTFDRNRWEELRKERAKDREKIPASVYEMAYAAPKMEVLTRSSEWNEFLAYVQARIEQAKNAIETAKADLLHPALWNHEEIVRRKAMILALQHEMTALEHMVEIPKKIVEQGKQADEVFKQA